MQAFFVPASHGQRFCLLHEPPPGHACRGAMLYIHPLAEEMNRCRQVASLQARALAQQGFAVLQMDLLGCGDSAGDFADASWDAWLDDVERGLQWLGQHYAAQVWLWGMRAGCLLAAAHAARAPQEPLNLLLWQPVASGRQHLQQLLRLRQMAELVQGGARQGVQELMACLEQGQPVEVAGYTVSPQLALGLSAATLEGLSAAKQVVCLEVVSSAQASPYGPAAPLAAALQRCTEAGIAVHSGAVEGESFWLQPEAPTCHALVDATLAAMART